MTHRRTHAHPTSPCAPHRTRYCTRHNARVPHARPQLEKLYVIKIGEVALYRNGELVEDPGFVHEIAGFTYLGEGALTQPVRSPYTVKVASENLHMLHLPKRWGGGGREAERVRARVPGRLARGGGRVRGMHAPHAARAAACQARHEGGVRGRPSGNTGGRRAPPRVFSKPPGSTCTHSTAQPLGCPELAYVRACVNAAGGRAGGLLLLLREPEPQQCLPLLPHAWLAWHHVACGRPEEGGGAFLGRGILVAVVGLWVFGPQPFGPRTHLLPTTLETPCRQVDAFLGRDMGLTSDEAVVAALKRSAFLANMSDAEFKELLKTCEEVRAGAARPGGGAGRGEGQGRARR